LKSTKLSSLHKKFENKKDPTKTKINQIEIPDYKMKVKIAVPMTEVERGST